MLTRVDEFVGMLDMVSGVNINFCCFIKVGLDFIALPCSIQQIRNDTSQIVNENLPQIQQKSDEMRQIYRRIDKLEVSVNISSSGSMPELFLWHAVSIDQPLKTCLEMTPNLCFWIRSALKIMPPPADLCQDGGSQRQRNGGAGHAGGGWTRNATQRVQEDLPQHERAQLLKRKLATHVSLCQCLGASTHQNHQRVMCNKTMDVNNALLINCQIKNVFG